MILAIVQPYFFPYLGYFQLINAADKFVVYDDVNYIKGGWVNRNKILSNGVPTWFTLELLGASQNKTIREIEIGGNRARLLKTVRQCYAKAPYFTSAFECVASILENDETNLAKFLYSALVQVCEYLNITTEFCYSSDLDKDCSLKGEQKIRQICCNLDANMYINPIGGMKLYDRQIFANDGIDLRFLQMSPDVEYKQFRNVFVPYLSIIDVMMFNSVEQIGSMLGLYALISEYE
jgi:hypothetical protein